MASEEHRDQSPGLSRSRQPPPKAALYLDLLEAAVCGRLIEDPSIHPEQEGYHSGRRSQGVDWPQYAHTMIGSLRAHQLRRAVEQILQEGVAGDLLETGVWRGGACILMRGVLAAYGISDRKIWVCDSFQGLPPPNSDEYPADAGDNTYTYAELRVPVERVRQNFANYGLLDDQVIFVEGWFKDTLEHVSAEKLAILRLDGDMYESTTDALQALYSKLSPGGFLIVDDYALPSCRKAIDDFRDRHGITEPVRPIDHFGAYWRRDVHDHPPLSTTS